MSFIDSGSEITVSRVSSGNMLDGIDTQLVIWQQNSLIKNVLIPFDGDAKDVLLIILMYLQIARS